MATTPKTLDPPFFDPPIVDAASGQQQHSQAWTEYHQQAADQISAANAQIATLTTQIAAVGQGVTDGSNAAAGQVGEYLTATSGAVSLASGAATTLASIILSAGDWDVAANVRFVPAAQTIAGVACGISTASGSYSSATAGFASINGNLNSLSTTVLACGTVRASLTTTTTYYVVATALFTGTSTATGFIRARRAR